MHLRTAQSLVGFALCSVAWVGVAAAQQAPPPQPMQAPPIPDTEQPPIAGKTTLGLTVAETDVITTGWRASKLLHADVYNGEGNKIGKVDDFIVAPDGTLSAAVLEVGGFLGVGAHKVLIPINQLGKLGTKLVLNGATKDSLKRLPEFKYAQ